VGCALLESEVLSGVGAVGVLAGLLAWRRAVGGVAWSVSVAGGRIKVPGCLLIVACGSLYGVAGRANRKPRPCGRGCAAESGEVCTLLVGLVKRVLRDYLSFCDGEHRVLLQAVHRHVTTDIHAVSPIKVLVN